MRWQSQFLVAFTMSAAPLVAQSREREQVLGAERRVGADVQTRGLAAALPRAMTDDAVLLVEGAPIVRGRADVTRLLAAQPTVRGLRSAAQPFRLLVSSDSTLAVTFGATAIQRAGEATDAISFGRYISVWRRWPDGSWRIAAYLQNGLIPGEKAVVSATRRAPSPEQDHDAFALADLAFARMAADSGAPAAFGHFAAPSAMTFAGTGELNIGPQAIRASLASSRAGAAAWRWWPVISIVAESQDLGATVGEAEILPPGAAQPFYSKYLTIWQRQPDGSLKYVVDAGSSRPARKEPDR